MSNPAQPCQCIPYSNLCCCGTQNGISVVQPSCQNLPDGTVINNPAFDINTNTSYWTYKFLTDCASSTRAISNFGIPICVEINSENIVVEEKIDGCGHYDIVPFELKLSDPNLGVAPDGFQWLKIEINDRYDKGVSVEYRISIIGDYPETTESIKVKAATAVYTFGCNFCYIVPGCAEEGKLLVSKKCETTISNNKATLQYQIHVDNVGGKTLDPVTFEDLVFIPNQLSLGTIVVDPATLSIDISVSGQVKIFGNLGAIAPGGRVSVSYSIPITEASNPGRYIINNTARAVAKDTEASALCQTSFDVVKLRASKCCSTDGNTASFSITVSNVENSPEVVVDIFDHMTIPSGVTVQFTSFHGFEAYFAGTLNPVPLNTSFDGIDVDFIYRNALVPFNGSFVNSITYTLVSSSVVGIIPIVNSITSVKPINLDNIVFEGTEGLPATANILVTLSQACDNTCN